LTNFCRPQKLQNSTNGCCYLSQTKAQSKRDDVVVVHKLCSQAILLLDRALVSS